ncbi:MAG: hopanoid C-3 methylase HpnR [Candidatus Tectomicrobia bacterium]|uniref:Hopanoid C-3 methylase HpnR n=1 Tax=Tectimicrobiota bacterium TaxID=2528274 RepID=A0A938B435_UNCTE|nr:hopanoid C-3 methylase HpnR [Candidatus Tectomicrobia bacterium]
MRVLLVHPSCLLYSEIYLRLEPLGLERVAQAVRSAGHDVRLLDLQVFRHTDYFHMVRTFRPEAIGFSLNYLANVPEVIELAQATRAHYPQCTIFVGGHSASFIPHELLQHAAGAIDCVLRGEGEASTPQFLAALTDGGITTVPGVVTAEAMGPPPQLLASLDTHFPARDLLAKRHKYFIGALDPCASIEFTRGCPWDCTFCSAWTFYGRSYRQSTPEAVVEDLAQIQEPHVFIVDDVAFIHPEYGMAIGQAIEKRGIRKLYYLETRCDVLLRNREVFAYWKRLGLLYMFLGIEALDEDTLQLHRKRVTMNESLQALEVARQLGLIVAINIIADPDWDVAHFRFVQEWAASVPEIVHLTVNTPYPGTETWRTEARRLTSLDYRLFDVQHAVLPTKLPLAQFYAELVQTQAILSRKHLGFRALWGASKMVMAHLRRGQTNFVRMLWKFPRIYNAARQYADHQRPVQYALTPPPAPGQAVLKPAELYVHSPRVVPRRTV